MKKKLRCTIISLILIIVSNTVNAQFNMTEQEKEAAIASYMEFQEELDLTDDQTERVKKINTTYFEGLAALKDSNKGKLEKFKTFKKLSTARDSEMAKVLNERQFGLYKKFQQKNRQRFKNKRNSSN